MSVPKVAPAKRSRGRRLGALPVAALMAALLWAGTPFLPAGLWEAVSAHASDRVVALTFDNGPNPLFTPMILDTLKAEEVPATFFMVGSSVARHPEIAMRAVQEGHEVGSHAYHHSYALPFELPRKIGQDYRAANKAIKGATMRQPALYRAPHGRLSPWMALALRREGAVIVGWDLDSKDLRQDPADAVLKRVIGGVRPGSIVLLHDGRDGQEVADRTNLVQALPQVIRALKARGYRFVTVSELLRQ